MKFPTVMLRKISQHKGCQKYRHTKSLLFLFNRFFFMFTLANVQNYFLVLGFSVSTEADSKETMLQTVTTVFNNNPTYCNDF